MAIKTDNAAEVGLHAFERAGLGKAPFKCVGVEEIVFTNPDGSTRAGGSCDYCSTGIRYAFIVRGADRREFKVGCECIKKSGDTGLIKQYKTLPAVRKMNRDKARAKDDRVIAEWKSLVVENEANRAKLAAYEIAAWQPGKMRPWLEYAENAWRMCGMAGRAKYLKSAKYVLAKLEAGEAP